MEALSRNNYESWFLDYLDGNLAEGQIDILLDFLAQNPDLQEELQGISGTTLEAGGETFAPKNTLLKTAGDIPGISTTDQLCIARMEGDLTEAEAYAFDIRLMEDAKLEATYSSFLLTRLHPSSTVTYPAKGELRKKTVLFTPWRVTAISAAALLILAIILWPRQQETGGPGLAGTTPPAAVEKQVPASPSNEKPPTVLANNNNLSREPAVDRPAGRNHTKAEAPAVRADEIRAAREVTPMQSLARKQVSFGPQIPRPESTRLLYASSYAPMIRIPSAEDVLSLPQLALKLFRERVLGQDPGLVKKTRFSMWEVAGAGINGINALAGTEMKLNREYDDKGQILAVSFNSRLLEVDAPVRGQSSR